MKAKRLLVLLYKQFPLEMIKQMLFNYNTVEAPISGHPREAEKVSASGAGRLRECVNTELV